MVIWQNRADMWRRPHRAASAGETPLPGTGRAGPVGALLGAMIGLSASALPVHAQSGQPDVLTETYGDWIVRCVSDPLEAQQALTCEMSQELTQTESGQRVLAVTLRREAEGGSGTLTILAPFGLLLPAGLQISVEGVELIDIGFRTCLLAGCIGIAEVDGTTVAAMALGPDITVTMTASATGDTVMIPLLVRGFNDAWTRLGR